MPEFIAGGLGLGMLLVVICDGIGAVWRLFWYAVRSI
jgi:hypothetical protein